MYRYFFIVASFLFLLGGCSSSSKNYESLVSDQDTEIRELRSVLEKVELELIESKTNLNNMQDELDDLNNSYKDDTESLKSKIIELESETVEVELGANYSESMTGFNFIMHYHNGMIGMGYNPNYFELYNNIKIVGYGDFDHETHRIIDLSGEDTATLKIDISGDLYNFKIGIIEWNDEVTSFSMTDVLCQIDKISNTDVLFNSVLAEGLPYEAITWEDAEGKEFNYLIGDNGLSGNAFPFIIISELME